MEKSELYDRLNRGILEERYMAFQRNLQKNLSRIREHGGLRKIVPRFSGMDVIVAGAGPSLDRGMPQLRELCRRENLIIIAADMALKPLRKNGIIPHYVISCETSPVDFFGGTDTENIHLIAFSCISSINLRKWRGDISFYNWMIFEPEYNRLWEQSGRDLGFLATGSIVTTQAVSLALGSGINSLALAGNDLAFKDTIYARGVLPMENGANSCDRFHVLPSTDMDTSRRRREFEIRRGSQLFYTNSQFLAAKTWLEELFSRQDIPVYDCSNPGCSGRYVIKTGMEDLLTLLGRVPIQNMPSPPTPLPK